MKNTKLAKLCDLKCLVVTCRVIFDVSTSAVDLPRCCSSKCDDDEDVEFEIATNNST